MLKRLRQFLCLHQFRASRRTSGVVCTKCGYRPKTIVTRL